METTLIIHEKQVWEKVERPGLDHAFIKRADIAEAVPAYHWTGGKIPWALRDQIHAQFEATNSKFHCESQCRLFYNSRTRTWAAWFFKQTKTGMTSNELPIPPDSPEYAQFLPSDGWGEFGSWHHHCSAGAFQSGTDKTDESERPGIHITTGGIGSNKYSLHTRFLYVFRGQKLFYTNLNMDEFFDLPTEYETLPAWAKARINPGTLIEDMLCSPVGKDVGFPQQWMDNMVDEVRPVWKGGSQMGLIPFGPNSPSYHGSSGADYEWVHDMDHPGTYKKVLKADGHAPPTHTPLWGTPTEGRKEFIQDVVIKIHTSPIPDEVWEILDDIWPDLWDLFETAQEAKLNVYETKYLICKCIEANVTNPNAAQQQEDQQQLADADETLPENWESY